MKNIHGLDSEWLTKGRARLPLFRISWCLVKKISWKKKRYFFTAICLLFLFFSLYHGNRLNAISQPDRILFLNYTSKIPSQQGESNTGPWASKPNRSSRPWYQRNFPIKSRTRKKTPSHNQVVKKKKKRKLLPFTRSRRKIEALKR